MAFLSICPPLQYCIYNFLAIALAVLTSVTPPCNIWIIINSNYKEITSLLNIEMLLHFFLFFRCFSLLLLEIKSLTVKLVYAEIMQLCYEAIDGNFEQFGRLLKILFKIFAKKGKEIWTFLNKSCNFISDILDDSITITFLPNRVKFNLSYLPYHELIKF